MPPHGRQITKTGPHSNYPILKQSAEGCLAYRAALRAAAKSRPGRVQIGLSC